MTGPIRAIDARAVAGRLDEYGYALVPGLVTDGTVRRIRDELALPPDGAATVAARQKRLLKPHLTYPLIWSVLSAPALVEALRSVLGAEPACIQSMYYVKPPGSSGLGLHRDKHYIRVEPGNCMAVWIAIDPATQENGCLLAVPGSHTQPVETRPRQQDPCEAGQRVYTDIHMAVPEGMKTVPVEVAPGDAVLFGGHLIHGSLPNRSAGLLRRSLVGHYVRRDVRAVSRRHHPVWDTAGREVTAIAAAEDLTFETGGPAGG